MPECLFNWPGAFFYFFFRRTVSFTRSATKNSSSLYILCVLHFSLSRSICFIFSYWLSWNCSMVCFPSLTLLSIVSIWFICFSCALKNLSVYMIEIYIIKYSLFFFNRIYSFVRQFHSTISYFYSLLVVRCAVKFFLCFLKEQKMNVRKKKRFSLFLENNHK